jgi:hypothetical protein
MIPAVVCNLIVSSPSPCREFNEAPQGGRGAGAGGPPAADQPRGFRNYQQRGGFSDSYQERQGGGSFGGGRRGGGRSYGNGGYGDGYPAGQGLGGEFEYKEEPSSFGAGQDRF